MSFAKPPPEEEYLGKMPAEFQMIAALLGDLDNSAGQGAVYFRQDNSAVVLSRVDELVKAAFPEQSVDESLDAVVVTWENMAARGGASGRGDGPETKVSRLCVFLVLKGTCLGSKKISELTESLKISKAIFSKVL